jgi:hypothetical protein
MNERAHLAEGGCEQLVQFDLARLGAAQLATYGGVVPAAAAVRHVTSALRLRNHAAQTCALCSRHPPTCVESNSCPDSFDPPTPPVLGLAQRRFLFAQKHAVDHVFLLKRPGTQVGIPTDHLSRASQLSDSTRLLCVPGSEVANAGAGAW